VALGAARTDRGHNGSWWPTMLQSTYDARVDDHIALNDPARVLRNVKAARLIIAAHPRAREAYDEKDDYCATCNEDCPCPTLRALASQYDDREGYRPEWGITE